MADSPPDSEDEMGLVGKFRDGLRRDHPTKFVAVYIGLALVLVFLLVVSLAPQVGQKLGQLTVKKSQQQSFAAALEDQIKSLNIELVASVGRQAGGGGLLGRKKAPSRSALETSRIRKELLLSLARENPARVFNVRIPADVRNKFPTDVQTNIEEDVNLEGSLTVVHEDNLKTRHSKNSYFLRTDAENWRLLTGDSLPPLSSGDRVRVLGLGLEDTIVFNLENTLEVLEPASPTPTPNHKTLGLLVNFQDSPVTGGKTPDDLKRMLFDAPDSIGNFYKEVSYGKVNLSGDVRGWYTLPTNSTCDYLGFGQAIFDNLQATLSFENYQHIVIFMASDNLANCPWAGLAVSFVIQTANSLAFPTVAYTRFLEKETIAHELGHNFGMNHTATVDCGSLPFAESGCSYSGYGDIFDIMAGAYVHPKALNKELAGWLSGQIIDVNLAGAGGQFTIEPYETATGGPKAIRIRHPATKRQYYLEYRRRLGFDNRPEFSLIENGALIHTNVTQGQYNTYELVLVVTILIDATPNPSLDPTVLADFQDAACRVGCSISDPVGFTITVREATASKLVVDVQPSQGTGTVGPSPSSQYQLATPTDVTAVALGPNKISLFWKTVEDVDGYKIYRKKVTEAEFAEIATKVANVFTDTNTNTADFGYHYSIRAYTADGRISDHSVVNAQSTVILSDAQDKDNDGFSTSLETFLGTNSDKACGQNAWPPDFNDDRQVDITDVTKLSPPAYNTQIGDRAYNKRYDLNADGKVNMGDIEVIRGFFFKSCAQ